MAAERQPWLKWYPADWRGEPRLKLVSRAARSLWVDLIGLMHDAHPYGHLLIDGVPPTVADLSSILGDKEADISRLLAELKARKVCSVTDDGVIFSRRMVRDSEKADRDKANGKGGGNPRLKGSDNGGVNPPDNPPDNPPHNRKDNRQVNGGDKAQKPEARSQRLEPENQPGSVSSASARELPLDRLCRLMKLDHRALQRKLSFQGFAGIFHDWKVAGCDPERDIWPTIERIAARGQDIGSPKFFEKAIFKARDDRLASEPTERERWATRLEAYRIEGFWPEDYGPKPGDPGCLCPPELLIEVAA